MFAELINLSVVLVCISIKVIKCLSYLSAIIQSSLVASSHIIFVFIMEYWSVGIVYFINYLKFECILCRHFYQIESFGFGWRCESDTFQMKSTFCDSIKRLPLIKYIRCMVHGAMIKLGIFFLL